MAKKQQDETAPKQTFKQKMTTNLERGAQKGLIEDFFNDIYAHRLRIYWVNFIRGISFSVGGIIGATLIIALLVWILSLFGHLPVVGNFFQQTQNTITHR